MCTVIAGQYALTYNLKKLCHSPDSTNHTQENAGKKFLTFQKSMKLEIHREFSVFQQLVAYY